LTKQVKDLLTKKFDFDRSVELKTKTANGVTFDITTTHNTSDDDSVSVEFEGEYKHAESGLSLKTNVYNSGVVKAKGKWDLKEQVEGLKLILEGKTDFLKDEKEDDSKKQKSTKLGFEFLQDDAALSGDIEFVDGPKVSLAGVGRYEGFLGALSFAYDGSKEKEDGAEKEKVKGFAGWEAAAGYHNNEFLSVAKGFFKEKKLEKFVGSYFHKLNTEVDVGAQLTYATNKESQKKEYTFEVAGEYRWDADCTVKGKVNSAGVVSTAYIHNIKPQCRLTVSSEVDATNFEKDSHKFGLAIKLGETN